jgi:hypothetical protein
MTQVEELTFIDDIPAPDVRNEETPILDRLLACAEIVLAPDRERPAVVVFLAANMRP